MNARTQASERVGMWSAGGAAITAFLYVVVGLMGVVARQQSGPDPLRQVDPYLAILETLMILFAALLVITLAAVYSHARPERRTCSLAALAFVICFAALTCSVHFVSLTLGRQINPMAYPVLSHQLLLGTWPTVALSLDLLAWDFFLGLALIFAADAFKDDGRRAVRISLVVAGSLCLAAALGPLSGHLQIQYLGIAGYAFALPVACVLLAVTFRSELASKHGGSAP